MSEYIDKSDAETVFREIRKRLSAKKKDYEAIEFLIKYQMLSVAEEVIHAIPAADVQPVVRGKWLNDFCGKGRFSKRIVQCSLCGNFLDLDGVNAGRGDANFCPNCGADMREES